MKIEGIFLKPESAFSKCIEDWATQNGIVTQDYDVKMGDSVVDGLLLINQNQDIEKETDELHTDFDKKHISTQKIDINGTLQVAVSNFELWLRNYKSKNILILGADDLVKNKNLSRFLNRISK